MDTPGIVLYDGDSVEEHNIPASFYKLSQNGVSKPVALAANIEEFMGVRASVRAVDFDAAYDVIETDAVIVAVDDRRTRIALWESIKTARLIVDVRSGRDLIQILSFDLTKNEHDGYLKSLEHEGMAVPCSSRSVAYNSYTAAGLAGAIIKSWSVGEPFPRDISVDHRGWYALFNDVK